MKDNNIENIVTLELVKEDELYKFKKDLQESFSVAVIEEFGSVDAGPIPSDEEIEKRPDIRELNQKENLKNRNLAAERFPRRKLLSPGG